MEEFRAFCVTMFSQHDQLLVDLVGKMMAERAADTKVALTVSERRHKLGSRQTAFEPWATSVDEILGEIPVQAKESDPKLRGELREYSMRLAESEHHMKTVNAQFVFHVKDAFGRADETLTMFIAQPAG